MQAVLANLSKENVMSRFIKRVPDSIVAEQYDGRTPLPDVGPRLIRTGDWLLRYDNGETTVMSDKGFTAMFKAVPDYS